MCEIRGKFAADPYAGRAEFFRGNGEGSACGVALYFDVGAYPGDPADCDTAFPAGIPGVGAEEVVGNFETAEPGGDLLAGIQEDNDHYDADVCLLVRGCVRRDPTYAADDTGIAGSERSRGGSGRNGDGRKDGRGTRQDYPAGDAENHVGDGGQGVLLAGDWRINRTLPAGDAGGENRESPEIAAAISVSRFDHHADRFWGARHEESELVHGRDVLCGAGYCRA